MVDFAKNNELRNYIMETTGGPAAGGLTVLDVAAFAAMQGMLANKHMGDGDLHDSAEEWIADIVTASYEFAEKVMEVRVRMPPRQETCTLEEAFGFEKPEPGSWMEIKK